MYCISVGTYSDMGGTKKPLLNPFRVPLHHHHHHYQIGFFSFVPLSPLPPPRVFSFSVRIMSIPPTFGRACTTSLRSRRTSTPAYICRTSSCTFTAPSSTSLAGCWILIRSFHGMKTFSPHDVYVHAPFRRPLHASTNACTPTKSLRPRRLKPAPPP